MAARAGNIRSRLLNLLSYIRLAIGSLFVGLLHLLRGLGASRRRRAGPCGRVLVASATATREGPMSGRGVTRPWRPRKVVPAPPLGDVDEARG